MNQANIEQLRAILSVLAAYRDGAMVLPRLSQELRAGHYGLVDPPQSWTEGFEQHWAVIEEVNAVLLDGGMISGVERGVLEQSVNDLRDLVRAHLP